MLNDLTKERSRLRVWGVARGVEPAHVLRDDRGLVWERAEVDVFSSTADLDSVV